MAVVIGRLSDWGMDNPEWVKVREAQVKVANEDPRAAWVDTDDCNNLVKDGEHIDGLHYSKEGYAEFGKRLAQAAVKLAKSSEGQEKK